MLERWLDTITRNGTKYSYKTSFKAYAYFTYVTASASIDEALEDLKKDPRERHDVVMTKLGVGLERLMSKILFRNLPVTL